MVSSFTGLIFQCLRFRYGRRLSNRASPAVATITSFNDSFLLAQRHGLSVSLSGPHAVQADFLLQDKAAFNNKNLLDNGNHRRVALLSNRWSGIDRPTYRHPLNL